MKQLLPTDAEHWASGCAGVARSGWYRTTTLLAVRPFTVATTLESMRRVVRSTVPAGLMSPEPGTLTSSQSLIAQVPGQAPVADRLTEASTAWVSAAGICVVPTSSPAGSDVAAANGLPPRSVVRVAAVPAGR